MSLPLNQSVLVESPSLRTSALSNLDDSRAEVVLNKAKAIVFAVWNGSGWATTAQIGEYFSVTESAVKELYRVNQSEFLFLETKTLTGKDLRDARQTLCLPSRTSQVRVFSTIGALRIAMMLQQSQIAAQVRTIILDLVAAVPSITAQTPVPAPALPPVEGITVPKRENCTLRLVPLSNKRFSDTYFPSPAKDATCQNWSLVSNSKHNPQ